MPQKKPLYLTTSGAGLLTAGLIIASLKIYNLSVQNEQLKDKITLEKSIHQNQISEILKRYDAVNENQDTKETIVTSNRSRKTDEANFKTVRDNTKKTAENKLKAVNLSARSVRLISKDIVETNLSSKINQVRIRFTLENNENLEPGNKKISVQVVNPKNRLLTLNGHSDTKLIKEVFYDGLNTDACLFVDLYQHHLIMGDYKINLICEGEVIGSTNFRVN